MPSINELYKLRNDNTHLVLNVLIGQAGFGETTVYIDGIKHDSINIDSFEIALGPNKDFSGKVLEVKTYVGKVPGQSQRTSVIITLNGGSEKRDFPNHDSSRDNPVIFHSTFYLSL